MDGEAFVLLLFYELDLTEAFDQVNSKDLLKLLVKQILDS